MGFALPAAATGTAWGATGASYSGGILCRLGGATVPMATWSVNGIPGAYSTADVVERGGTYGPAPTSGAQSPITPGRSGLSAPDITAVAYLIEHGSGSAADVAESSATIAAATGGGGAQAQCLGQQGTSARHAASQWQRAQSYAGPYTVTVDASPAVKAGGADAAATARVESAAGLPTPGLEVTFRANGEVRTDVTGRDGKASTPVIPSATAATRVTATVNEPISLTYVASDPAAVRAAAPTTASGSGTLRPAPRPRPAASVGGGRLLLAATGAAPVVTVSGVYRYSGEGSVTVSGPVQPRGRQACAALQASDFSSAPRVWTGHFAFTGDGPRPAGESPPLVPGCYSATADLATTNSVPSAGGKSGFDPQATITVSSLVLTQSAGAGVAPPGPLPTTVTASKPGRASVSSSVTVYGPLDPRSGTCTGLNWGAAPMIGTTRSLELSGPDSASQAGRKLTAEFTAPRVGRLGCYALRTRSVITQDGMTLTSEPRAGGAGSTTLVARPGLAVATSSYAGRQGAAMTGRVTVDGSYNYPGKIAIGLRASSGTPVTGCRDATFSDRPATLTRTVVRSTGDGTYSFRTPIAPYNVCYAVTAVLTLDANPAVQGSSPEPSASSVFLAGLVPHKAEAGEARTSGGDSPMRSVLVLAAAALLVLGSCAFVALRAFADSKVWDELPFEGLLVD